MPFLIVRNDITRMQVDAIVNAANPSLLGGGGVDGAIHAAAGEELLRECITLGGCRTGQAKITGGYRLPCKYIIHTVGPVWNGGDNGEEALLSSCYASSLELARQKGCESIAFPLISAGAYGYPRREAIQTAVSSIRAFLAENEMTVYLVLFGRGLPDVSDAYSEKVRDLLGQMEREDRNSATGAAFMREDKAEEAVAAVPQLWAESFSDKNTEKPSERHKLLLSFALKKDNAARGDFLAEFMAEPAAATPAELHQALSSLDEGFRDMLFRLIDEKGISDVECYKKANIDRKVFSKIRSTPDYRPSKTTAVAFALALELPLDQAKRLIGLAGYSLTHSNKFDIIIEYFIEHRNYDIYAINEVLFDFDQRLLG